jgi:hypothetical protein
MAETADYDPGPWKGYDFKSARASYDSYAGRSYSDAVSKGITVSDLVPTEVETQSEYPLVIACDVTGSMGSWPATIFSKLPYLDIEGKEYLGEGMEISFAAIGDAYSDKYPLQVQPFVKGKELENSLTKLVVEGGGGGTAQESYDLAALYYAKHIKMPNAINKPIFIFIGDEGLYDQLPGELAENYAKAENERFSLDRIMGELKEKFSVYVIRKPYGSYTGNAVGAAEERIQKQWEDQLGADHVCSLPDASRVVDVIFGILAKETGKVDYFRKEIADRQEKDKVDVVMKSLNTIHRDKKASKLLGKPQASITRKKGEEGGGKKAIPLLD